MRRLSQLGMLLTILSVPVYKWAHPPLPIPQNDQPLTPETIDRDWQAEQDRKAVENDARIAEETLSQLGCEDYDFSPVSIAQAARAQNLSVRLVSAQVMVESSCRETAISSAGAVGLMQVNVKVWPYSKQEMLDPDRNLQAGTKILANYIRESGNVRDGLRHYYGILPDSTASDEYADKVLSMTRRR